jgi:hypothetical protein
MALPKRTIKTNSLYESQDGFSTSIWGAPLWHLLHIISFAFPCDPTTTERLNYETFICLLRHVLPCGACRRNYAQNLIAVKFSNKDLKNRKAFSKFVYRLRQEVNNKIGAQKLPLSFDQTHYAYECFRLQKIRLAIPARLIMQIAPEHQLVGRPSLEISKEVCQLKPRSNSKLDFTNSVWVSVLWHVLHVISFNYPMHPTQEDQTNYFLFICSLEHVLPNSIYRLLFKQKLDALGFSDKNMKDRHHFSRFIYNLNKCINTNVEQSYYKLRHCYECFRAKCGKPQAGQEEQGCIIPKTHVKSRIVMKIGPVKSLTKSPSLDISQESFSLIQ